MKNVKTSHLLLFIFVALFLGYVAFMIALTILQ